MASQGITRKGAPPNYARMEMPYNVMAKPSRWPLYPGRILFWVPCCRDEGQLIHDKKTGVPSNDVDRSGKGQAVEFAQPKKGLALTYKDFFVI